MDNDTRDLVVRLCSQAGAMMEDASAAAVTAAGLDAAALREAVRRLETTSEAIRAIIAAAAALSAASPTP